MAEQGFDQLNYPQELGTGTGASIHDYGCAECSVASECVSAGHSTNPLQLNQDLINNNGYASNGSGANDELIWSAISKVYPDMQLAFNKSFPSTPADMSLIDGQLNKGVGVVVGVSFHHDAKQEAPDHFIRIYKKNADGSYQCFDPWAVDGIVDVNFNQRYAVNGMSAANAILQAVSYNYTPSQNTVNGVLYKGLDLTNQDSMKVAVDAWSELSQGQLVQKSAYDAKVAQDQDALNTANNALSKAQLNVQSYEGVCALLGLSKDQNGDNPSLDEVTQSINALKKTSQDRLQALNTANQKLTKAAESLKVDPADDYDLGLAILQIEKDRDTIAASYTDVKEELGLADTATDKDVSNAIIQLQQQTKALQEINKQQVNDTKNALNSTPTPPVITSDKPLGIDLAGFLSTIFKKILRR